MTRSNWQQIAERWLIDAQKLLDEQRWSAAYYVMGYAVECGLKACIMARLAAHPEVIFEDRRFSERCWTHSLSDLIKLADLETALANDTTASPTLRRHWSVVKDWNEGSRYKTISHQMAKRLYKSITDPGHGAMSWIRVRW